MEQEPQERVGHFPSAVMFFSARGLPSHRGNYCPPPPKSSTWLRGSVLVASFDIKSQVVFGFWGVISIKGSSAQLPESELSQGRACGQGELLFTKEAPSQAYGSSAVILVGEGPLG